MGLLIYAVNSFINVLTTLLFVYIILSWFARDPYSTVYRIYSMLGIVAEPLLMPFRRLMGRFSGASMGIDFSPILAFLTLRLIRSVLITLLVSIGY